ncbi:MAG: 1-acyl-sn-glycerol-3-phosphate acyltransferase [Candidatus Tectomicrobia bacterium]|nr:1-acyl-sn-glycerol-3-phosphate acyltransferase [Candidatus Tectomicrobia bacterium]
MADREENRLPPGHQPGWLKALVSGFFRLAYGGAEVTGLEHVPRQGPLIVAPTHRSYLDPVILSAFLPRALYYMAKSELFEQPILRPAIRFFGAFPVDRDTARGSTFRTALRLLRLGGAVAVFPEGGIVEKMGDEMKAGVGTLASMSAAPVLPVYVAGSNTLFSWPEALSDSPWLILRVAPPISPPAQRGRNAREEVTRRVMDALAGLERAPGTGASS